MSLEGEIWLCRNKDDRASKSDMICSAYLYNASDAVAASAPAAAASEPAPPATAQTN